MAKDFGGLQHLSTRVTSPSGRGQPHRMHADSAARERVHHVIFRGQGLRLPAALLCAVRSACSIHCCERENE